MQIMVILLHAKCAVSLPMICQLTRVWPISHFRGGPVQGSLWLLVPSVEKHAPTRLCKDLSRASANHHPEMHEGCGCGVLRVAVCPCLS